MKDHDEEPSKLEQLYDWIKEDNASTEAMLVIIASAILFAGLVGIIWLLAQL